MPVRPTLDGSFVEEKNPHDLDLVSFYHRLVSAQDTTTLVQIRGQNPTILVRATVKQTYNLYAFFLDPDGDSEDLVSTFRYLLQLFSHHKKM